MIARATASCIAVLSLWLRPVAAETPAQALGAVYAAYDRGDLAAARAALPALVAVEQRLRARDRALWIRGAVLLASDDPDAARPAFAALAKLRASPLAAAAAWRLADCDWQDDRRSAAAAAYARLRSGADAEKHADLGTVAYRIAVAAKGAARAAALRAVVVDHPGHPLAQDAERELGAPLDFSVEEHLIRARRFVADKRWAEAVAELERMPPVDGALADRRTHLLGETLFDMRRRYGEAGELLLAVAPRLGAEAPGAMFRGARALSRADRDDEAIAGYERVVATFPSTTEAAEAQYLTGWLEYNRGRYAQAVPRLERTLSRYGASKHATDARWFLAWSHYLLGAWEAAARELDLLAQREAALEGGKARYWRARVHAAQGASDAALAGYRDVVARWPFSWYALLARARLAEAGAPVGPFGVDTPAAKGAPIGPLPDAAKLARDATLADVDELIAAGLGVEAGDLLERREAVVLAAYPRAQALALLVDRYRAAGNFHRPYLLAVVHGARALRGPAEGAARVWWEHAYPRAYADLIERHQGLGGNPPGYLWSIMRKESGFDPHVWSYADAQGLLQMIPATTIRVADELGLAYDPGRLYEPEFNVQTASWYIGRLLAKFKGQVPLGAGSFNSGPRPVMRWLDKQGGRPIDEWVELVAYAQTREYMKKVTENVARYRYLYQGEDYAQPLAVDAAYVVDELTY